MEKRLKIIGYFSLGLGILTALLCIVPYGLFLAILTGFIGLIISTIYVYLDTQHQINTKKITVGIMGMVLSSIPIIFMLILIILAKVNS